MSEVREPRARVAVGQRRPRLDAAAKVTGRAAYAADETRPGLLHARMVLSTEAHAQIVSIDASAALEVPGVRAVLTAADLPVVGGAGRKAEPLARDEVVFAGQPVALVVADSEAAAEDGAELVSVAYEPLPAVLDLERAIDPGAPLARRERGTTGSDTAMHGAVGVADAGAGTEGLSANVIDVVSYSQGDLEAAFAGCAAVAEGRFTTSWVHQAYLEPQVAVAWPEGDGGVAVRSSTQGTFSLRSDLADIFGLPVSQIRVEGATLGGAFGGKFTVVEPLVVGAALTLGRPVRLAFSRSEDFAAGAPAPGLVIDAKVGARADGTLVAIEARVLADSGAFADQAQHVHASGRLSGAYSFEAWHVTTYGVQTNRVGAGAYRAPHATPTAFALESLVDELAEQLELDPIDLRLRNVPAEGDLRVDGLAWPQHGLRETLEAIREHPVWQRRHRLPEHDGVGFAATLFMGMRIGSGAVVRLDEDGGLTILSGWVDMTGTDTGVAAIAAEIVGVAADKVRVVTGDTQQAPKAGFSAGSAVTYSFGTAVAAAAEDVREQILRYASERLEIAVADLELTDGAVVSVGAPDRRISLAEIGERAEFTSGPVEAHATAIPPALAPSAGAALVHVRVDPETGHVTIVDYVTAQDAGCALNPSLVEGQMQGGAVQSIGFALHEQLQHDEDGQLLTGSFLSYAVPDIYDAPPIESIIVEVPTPHGPLGARGIGESVVVPGAAAIANAIRAATGRRLRALPMTPERIWHALR